MKYYRVTIHKTSKPLFSSDRYSRYDDIDKKFKTLEEAKAYISEEYYKPVKRVKMFRDSEGEATQIGWIYCYTVPKAYYNYDESAYNCQDWVTIELVTETSEPIL